MRTHSGRRLCHLLFLLALAATAARAQTSFAFTDLGAAYSPSTSNAYAINASGQVVGQSNGNALVWNSGSATGISIGNSAATAINATGQIVGYNEISNARPINWNWNGSTYDAPTFLAGTLEAYDSKARGINASGQIVGFFSEKTVFVQKAVIWNSSSGALTILGTYGSANASANAINDSGQIVGYVNDGGGNPQAATWKWNGTSYDSTLFGGAGSQANAINASGQVIGRANGLAAIWNWNGSTYVSTNLNPSGTNSQANGINTSGQVVGTAEFGGNTRAFYYASGTLYDLNTLTSGITSGYTLTAAYGINDLGQIVGEMSDGEGSRAFVLTPVPEPSTYAALLGLAALGLAAYRRRSR